MSIARLAGLTLVALAATSASAQQSCELNGEPVNTSHGESMRGKTGLLRCREPGGQLQREQEVRNGVFVGAVRFYREGKLREEHAVNERGNKQGPARVFGADGQLERESTYEDGREVGLSRSFHPGGVLRRASFHGGTSEQAYAEFTPGGKLSGLRCGPRPLLAPAADDARLCGFGGSAEVELFDGSGRVRSRFRYVEGKPVRGETLQANGQPATVEEIDGNLRTERRFSPEGRVIREQAWAGGELATDRTFYLNGQPRSSTEWQRSEGGTRRLVREFHDNGKLATQGAYAVVRGRTHAIGTHERFDEAGRKSSETVHDDQGRPVRERAWDLAGALVRDDEVFPDGSRRAYAR